MRIYTYVHLIPQTIPHLYGIPYEKIHLSPWDVHNYEALIGTSRHPQQQGISDIEGHFVSLNTVSDRSTLIWVMLTEGESERGMLSGFGFPRIETEVRRTPGSAQDAICSFTA